MVPQLRLGLADIVRATILILACSTSSFAGTLSDVLQNRGVPTGVQDLPNLNKLITGYGVVNDEKVLLIAYYLADGSGRLHEPLFISRFDKVAHKWRNAQIPRQDARLDAVDCLGSVTQLHSPARDYYVGTHLSPSAGCTIVLSPELVVRKVLYGWFLSAFNDGTIVYHNSQVHFAPTHYGEVSMYDPERDTTVKIYPMKPYKRIRREHINKVRAVYSNDAWCRNRNHHCDPERFDNHLASKVEISDATGALAFVVNFDNKVTWTEGDRWRLEGFRELRRHLGSKGLGSELSDDLFRYLYADLARVKRLRKQEQVAESFKEDPELRGLLADAFAGQRRTSQSSRAFFGGLDPRWEYPGIWERLIEAIRIPPEFTEVAYIYRNVDNQGPIEYKEMLLSDLKARFGDIPIQKLLEPEILAQIFGR